MEAVGIEAVGITLVYGIYHAVHLFFRSTDQYFIN